MTDGTPKHLVAVWNPAYKLDALASHVQVLRMHSKLCREDAARRRASGQSVDESAVYDEAYVWWGHVRSPNRVGPLAEEVVDNLREIQQQLEETTAETHLYLTDYQSLYVAELVDLRIVAEQGELPDDEQAWIPPYYELQGLGCDAWFKLADVRCLVRQDLAQVAAELRLLANVNYHGRPVTLYGGMVNLPLLVTGDPSRHWFEPTERAEVTDGRLWVDWDTMESGGVADMERTLCDDLIGRTAWTGLDPFVRRSIATAEKTFRDHRTDPGYDFGPVLTSFSKALEMQLRIVVRSAVQGLGGNARFVHADGRSLDLLKESPTLGVLTRALLHEPGPNGNATADAVRKAFPAHAKFLTEILPAWLREFNEIRNDGTHSGFISQADAMRFRNTLLGVGCDGHFVALGRLATGTATPQPPALTRP